MDYDSKEDTQAHIKRVQELMAICGNIIFDRAMVHDASKLESPEKEIFDEYTPKLKDSVYGSDEYKSFLAGMGGALQHHYQNNSHHPEHYENGIDGMSLFDLIEMVCDWKAAGERHATGSIYKSLEHNKSRFGVSEQLQSILQNTVKEFEKRGWHLPDVGE